MKKGQICEGIVECVGFPNKAIVITREIDAVGEEQEFRIIVKGAFTGQKVKYVVKKVRKNEGQGRLLEVVEKSPLEIDEPACKHFGVCGGCNYQSLPYKEQLKLKKEQVVTLIDKALKECRGTQDESKCEYSIQKKDTMQQKDFVKQKDSVQRKDSAQRKDFVQQKSSIQQKSFMQWNSNVEDIDFYNKEYIYDGIIPSPQVYGYRNKMEFSFGDEYKGGPLALGLHKKGSTYDIVNASGCQIVHDDYSKIIDCVKEYFSERKIMHYNKNTHIGVLRHLLIRRAESTKELLVALVTTSQMEISKNVKELGAKLENLTLEGKLAGFIHIINDGLGDVVKSDETHIIFGKDWITEKILGLKFRISLFSFFQTNTKGAELLYERVREYVLGNFVSKSKGELVDNEIDTNYGTEICHLDLNKKTLFNAYDERELDLHDKIVFDLYSGTGTIAQIIAPVVKRVIGVEIVEEAVEAARKNAKENGLDNCEFIAGDVLKVLDDIEEKPDFIILDPPRDGINPKALRQIIDFGVDRIVYVSCKPTSLARDLLVFEERGYRMERMSNVDLFPNTVHVEAVVLIQRKDT